MTKQEAINALQRGCRVAHKLFLDNEYIFVADDEYYKDEIGMWIPKDEFWEYRQGEQWENGWRTVK